MMRYLKALAPRTRVAIFTMGQELRVLHDFTDDPASLRARLEKVTLGIPADSATDFTRSVDDAEQLVALFREFPGIIGILQNSLAAESMANSASRARRLERSLGAMEALGKHLSGIPGRKNLVWIGAGVSMFSLETAKAPLYTIRDDFESKVQSTSRRLAQDGVVLYIVDSKGLKPPEDLQASYIRSRPATETGNFDRQSDAEKSSADPLPAMRKMAGITGGRYLFNTNDFTLGFQQVAADLRGSYTLGFYAPEEPDDKWHKLKVQVKRPGAEVRHRDGYQFSAPPPQTLEWTAETWSAAFSNPVGSSAIALTAALAPAAGGERRLNLTMGVDGIEFRSESGNALADLQIAVGELGADGLAGSPNAVKLSVNVPASKWDETAKTGISFERQWKPSPDATRVRVVVLDINTGRYGSVDLKLR
jgi:VWFA-related protein